MNSGIAERGPLILTDGPLTLAVGGEPAVTRWEILGHPYSERVPMDAIRGKLQAIEAADAIPEDGVATLFIDDSATASGSAGQSSAEIRALLLTCATLLWQMRIQDIAETSAPLNQAAVDNLGRLSIAGEPLLNELRAQRQKQPVTDTQEFRELTDLVGSLRKNIVFGAAGLAAAEPAAVPESAKKATAADGWAPKVGLLIAAEECLAGNLTARLAGSPDAAELAAAMDLILDNRREDLALVQGLEELHASQARFASGRIDRVRQRATLKRLAQIGDASIPFVTMRQGSGTGEIVTATMNTPEVTRDHAPEEVDEQALAAALGESFERALPVARGRVAELKTRYPGAGVDQLATRLRRRFHDEVAGTVVDENDPGHDLLDLVAIYAMGLAIVREVPVGDPAKRKAYARTLTTMVRALGVSQAVQDSPMLRSAFRFAQRQLIEFVFSQLGNQQSRLDKVGIDRKGFKNLRSKVWRARFDPEIADATGNALHGGMVRLLAAGINQTMR